VTGSGAADGAANQVALAGGAEFDAIRAVRARWGERARGLGDDAAIVALSRGDRLVASVDAAVEGRHFRREWLTPREIGYRAAAAALSDLAAMAAEPTGMLVALVVPDSWRAELLDVADGIGDAAELAHAPILGGNISGGGELSITTTVLGAAFTPLARAGARAGDRVYVTGTLGAPAEAIRLLCAGRDPGAFRDRFAHPVPRITEARWLVRAGASSGVDVSDGLAADLEHLATASGVAMEIDAARVPVVDGVDTARALGSGEEYEMVVTSNAPLDGAAFATRFAIPLTEIGRVVLARSGEPRLRIAGARVADIARYDHFSS
jgi:thiamine-monophosphate kinase